MLANIESWDFDNDWKFISWKIPSSYPLIIEIMKTVKNEQNMQVVLPQKILKIEKKTGKNRPVLKVRPDRTGNRQTCRSSSKYGPGYPNKENGSRLIDVKSSLIRKSSLSYALYVKISLIHRFKVYFLDTQKNHCLWP